MDQVSDYNYELPEELIAQAPPAERGASRMLVVSREGQSLRDDLFCNFYRYVRPGDCLVLNNTRVFPARLHGRRNSETGAEIEVFLHRAIEGNEIWTALVKPGKRVRTGDRILFSREFHAEVLAEGDYGERTLRLIASGDVSDFVERLGQTPLPPYIHRAPDASDRERYQTVFAQQKGSVAAPTAGLHFTPEMLQACREAGAQVAEVTLHVGLGTFAPLRQERLDDIRLHEEHFHVSEAAAATIRNAGRVLCVGTTSVRTVETWSVTGKTEGETSLFIRPGFRFQATRAMLTNFHLPQSSLLMLVCAFAGYDLALAAYRHAVAQEYKFFSYGDCMLIE